MPQVTPQKGETREGPQETKANGREVVPTPVRTPPPCVPAPTPEDLDQTKPEDSVSNAAEASPKPSKRDPNYWKFLGWQLHKLGD